MKHVLLSMCIANSICPTEIVRAIYQLGTHTVNFCLDDKAKKILVEKKWWQRVKLPFVHQHEDVSRNTF